MSTVISSSDVAALAGVAPSTVSNWRKRHDDFPDPAEMTQGGRDLFDLNEVERWLKQHRNLADDAVHSRFVFSAFDALRNDYATQDAVGMICTALTRRAHELTSQPFDSSLLMQSSADNPSERAEKALNAAARELESDELAPTFERVLEYAERTVPGKGGAEWSSGIGMTLLVERLLRNQESVATVFDPACGQGGFLAASASAAPDARLSGQEVNADTARMAAQRLRVHAHSADIRLGDSLKSDAFRGQRFDAVVCDPPWGVRLRRADAAEGAGTVRGTRHADLLWVSHVLDHVAPDGHGYIVLPMGPLFRGGAEAEIRRDLVRRGAVEAVIALPSRFVPRTSIPSALWVLRGTADAGGGPPPVLFADFANISPGAGAALADQVAHLLTTWRTDDTIAAAGDARAASVAVIDLLDRDVNLLPSRRIAHEVDDAAVAAFRTLFEHGQEQLVELVQTGTALPAVPDLDMRDTHWMPLTDLAETGHLGVLRSMGFGRLRQPEEVTLDADDPDVVRVIRAKDVRIGLGDTSDAPLLVSKPPQGSGLPMTQPGDVLVAAVGGPRVAATVDMVGGHLLGPDVLAVRLNGDTMPPRVAAYFLQAPRNSQALTGTGIPRVHARELELPAFKADHAAKLDELLGVLEAYEAAGQQIVTNVAVMRRAVVETAAESTEDER
jgi:methylase of polypeptide subunit release factors